MSDIDKILETDVEGGKSVEILNLEFEEEDHDGNEEGKKQRWKHKLTGRMFWQFCSKSGNTMDTGIWNKQLKIIASGKLEAAGKQDESFTVCQLYEKIPYAHASYLTIICR